jgi:hypothetical protein
MKKYYYSDGIEKFGPFTIEELQGYDIKSDTMMWAEGMEDWKPAGQMPQIAMLFDLSSPPPAMASAPSTRDLLDDDMEDDRPMPKNYLVESILVTFFCCLPLGIVGIINAAKVETAYRTEGYRAAKKASDEALKWTKIGFWVGLVFLVLYLIVVIGAAVVGGI